jgi:hypothetical protein
MRNIVFIAALLFNAMQVTGQQAPDDALRESADTLAAPWSGSAAAYYYMLPEEKNTTTLFLYVDYNSIHMEARYNYEDEQTVSLFGGYRFETGNELLFGATPLIGIVLGNTNAIAPGLEIDIAWNIFDFYSENEYVFDFEDNDNHYFYSWSELAVTPFNNFRTGIAADHTRLFQSNLELQRGVFAQYSLWKLTGGIHYFNPFSDEYFLIGSLAIDF